MTTLLPTSPAWLGGVRARAIFTTQEVAIGAECVGSPRGAPLLGEYGNTTSHLVARYPKAREIILCNAGKCSRSKTPGAFQKLQAFTACETIVCQAKGSGTCVIFELWSLATVARK
jgi:hypothetical protein